MAFKMKGMPGIAGVKAEKDLKKELSNGKKKNSGGKEKTNPYIGMDVDELDHRRGAILDYIDEGSDVSTKQRRDLQLIQKAMELDPSNK